MKDLSREVIRKKELYIKFAPVLVQYVRRFVDGQESEDIVHDTFIRFWNKAFPGLKEEEQKKMLYVIARNLCIDLLRRASIGTTTLENWEIKLKLEELLSGDIPDTIMIREEQEKELKRAINELPTQCRVVLELYYMENMKTAEIAEKLSLSSRTVENHLYRAIRLLRQKSDKFITLLFSLISIS